MRTSTVVIGAVWVLFWGYWLVSARGVKRGRVPWSREVLVRVVLVIVVVVLERSGVLHGGRPNTAVWSDVLGVVLVLAGLGFACSARVHLGRNWGTPMSRKEDPELVTAGPYKFVRHPIYSGIVLALVGTAAALTWTWLFAAGLAAAYFLYCAIVEERFMASEFPDAYPAYKRATKWFVPFLL